MKPSTPEQAHEAPIQRSTWSVASPDKSLKISVALESKAGEAPGSLTYNVEYRTGDDTTTVILPSRLGIVRQDQAFSDSLTSESAAGPIVIDEWYTLPHGKQRQLRNHANELTLTFRNESDARLQIILRAYNDGIAFRYRFPEQSSVQYIVTQELTTFALPMGGRAWIQPYDKVTTYSPAYETFFANGIPIGTEAPTETGWSFPALFHTGKHWILLTEADIDANYFGAHLGSEPLDGVYQLRFPLADEANGIGAVEPTASLPWATPWRVITVGTSASTIVESSLVRHLSASSKIEDTHWIRPGRASWSWWSDHASPRHYESLKAYIDLAAEMGWEYSLVDANWNQMIGGSTEDLVRYANEKGVGIFLWYNSGGSHNAVPEQPRDRMADRETRRAEFGKLRAWGVEGVKVDFFQSDKQNIMQLYLDILADAADYQIMVNFHGCTIPRGWSRTWPHLMTMDAVRGAEQYSFDPNYPRAAPWHNTILPFTRNVVGSMDYTPVTFSDAQYPHLTTFAHELALSVVFESGLLHLADSVGAYSNLPKAPNEFLRDVPAAWDETRYLAGEPGSFVVLARRSGDDWCIGGINGQEEAEDVYLDLSFLKAGQYAMALIQDGADDRSFRDESRAVRADETVAVTMRPRGGFVAQLVKQ